MTRYTVVWVREVRDELAELWLRAANRNAITEAAYGIGRELGEDAQIKGMELSEGLRSLFAPPLKAIFAVREDDRIVEVLRVRSF